MTTIATITSMDTTSPLSPSMDWSILLMEDWLQQYLYDRAHFISSSLFVQCKLNELIQVRRMKRYSYIYIYIL